MMKSFFYIVILYAGSLLLPVHLFAQLKSLSFEKIDSLEKTQKKSIVVFIHTDWCRFCGQMRQTTFKDAGVVQILNRDFYFTDLNAEETRSITFNEHVFNYKPSGNNTGTHELAEALGTIDNLASYPTLCVLNSSNEIIYQYAGFMDKESFLKTLEILRKNQ